MLLSRHIEQDRKAPELYGTFWFNNTPLTLRSLQGDVVMLFFWDYTSMLSLRLIRHMNRLHDEYGGLGLRIIGVQRSEFAVIHDPAKKEAIITSLGIRFPVVADDEQRIADSYRVSAVPTVCLIAPSGDIYDIQQPKDSVSRLERSIQYLLRQAGYFGDLPYVEYNDHQFRDYSTGTPTPDFEMGYLHGSLGNSEGYSPELPAEYHDPALHVEGKFYAEGIWTAGRNAFEFSGDDGGGYIIFPYTGNDVNVIVGNDHEVDMVLVTVDGQPVDTSMRGADILVDQAGATMLKTTMLRSAHLIRSRESGSHTVKLAPTQKGTTFYGVSLAPYDPDEEIKNASFSAN